MVMTVCNRLFKPLNRPATIATATETISPNKIDEARASQFVCEGEREEGDMRKSSGKR